MIVQRDENAEETLELALHVGEKLLARYESIRAAGALSPAEKKDLRSLEKIVRRLRRAPGGEKRSRS